MEDIEAKTVYSIYSTWIDGISRITRIVSDQLERSPKWYSLEQPLPLDIHTAIRLAKESVTKVTSVPETDFRLARVTLEAVEENHFWSITFLHSDSTRYASIEIGVLMDGTVVMPETKTERD
jgi:hypothetical protein